MHIFIPIPVPLKGHNTMSKSETTTHCLVFASIGASAVATNFFTNFETPLALGSAALAAGLFVFGFASLLVNNKNLKGDIDEQLNGDRMDSIWRRIAELEEEISNTEHRCNTAIEASAEDINRTIGQVYSDFSQKK